MYSVGAAGRGPARLKRNVLSAPGTSLHARRRGLMSVFGVLRKSAQHLNGPMHKLNPTASHQHRQAAGAAGEVRSRKALSMVTFLDDNFLRE